MSNQISRFKVSTFKKNDWAPISFVLFFLGGSILVGLSKFLELPTIIIIFIPILILVGYGLTAWFLPRLELRKDQIGDNLYYLGFLLTLVSLSVTLIQYSSSSNEDYIVSNFGVALVATIFGIAGRTFLNQMRKDVVAVEKEIQAMLSESALKLRGQISSTIENFASLNRQMEQITIESAQHISQAHKVLADGLIDSIDDVVKPVEASLNSVIFELKNQIYKATSEINSATESMVIELNHQTQVFSNVSKSYEEAIDFSDLKFDTSSLRKLEDDLSSYSENAGQSLASVYEKSLEQLELLNNSFNQVNSNTQYINQNLNESVQNLNNQLNRFVEGKNTLDDFTDSFLEVKELIHSLESINRPISVSRFSRRKRTL